MSAVMNRPKRMAHLCFLLKIEGIDLLKFALLLMLVSMGTNGVEQL